MNRACGVFAMQEHHHDRKTLRPAQLVDSPVCDATAGRHRSCWEKIYYPGQLHDVAKGYRELRCLFGH